MFHYDPLWPFMFKERDLSLDFCEIYVPLKTIKSRFPFLNNRNETALRPVAKHDGRQWLSPLLLSGQRFARRISPQKYELLL